MPEIERVERAEPPKTENRRAERERDADRSESEREAARAENERSAERAEAEGGRSLGKA